MCHNEANNNVSVIAGLLLFHTTCSMSNDGRLKIPRVGKHVPQPDGHSIDASVDSRTLAPRECRGNTLLLEHHRFKFIKT